MHLRCLQRLHFVLLIEWDFEVPFPCLVIFYAIVLRPSQTEVEVVLSFK